MCVCVLCVCVCVCVCLTCTFDFSDSLSPPSESVRGWRGEGCVVRRWRGEWWRCWGERPVAISSGRRRTLESLWLAWSSIWHWTYGQLFAFSSLLPSPSGRDHTHHTHITFTLTHTHSLTQTHTNTHTHTHTTARDIPEWLSSSISSQWLRYSG